ncbi:SusE domain-containing protein [Faecalibacter macacae]|uniref:SusF/SusE family outer membrane protein n=1 Tax=Faecalibacter macacae TaxID=1859289 RepID=A0A3L9MIP2_9FLAO|nr:SusE domain-containing protein [Faecalibacter macacae]RLZ12642.1 SusF/SusE family outer membrane protein [Faecalibacter macacae]
MKKIIKYMAAACLGIVSLSSCSDDDENIVLNPSEFTAPAITTTANTVALSEDTQTQTAITFEWTAASYGVSTTPKYDIELAKGTDTFDNAKVLTSIQETSYAVTGTDLNVFLVDQLGLEAGTEATVQYRIVSSLGTFGAEKLYSETKTFTVTPFSTDLSTPWGVVGSITDWGSSPDIPFWKTTTPNVLVAYLGVAVGDEIKFRKDADWAVNYGSENTTANAAENTFQGSLASGGSNIVAPLTGNYKITLDLNSLEYTAEFFQWGLVGSSTPNGWDGPDTQVLSFDGINEVWYANNVVLNAGELKIRKNNAWDENFGGANGSLVAGGDNITVDAGTYDIVVDFNNLTYTLTPAQ